MSQIFSYNESYIRCSTNRFWINATWIAITEMMSQMLSFVIQYLTMYLPTMNSQTACRWNQRLIWKSVINLVFLQQIVVFGVESPNMRIISLWVGQFTKNVWFKIGITLQRNRESMHAACHPWGIKKVLHLLSNLCLDF